MNAAQILDIICGSSTVHGLMDKSSSDAKYRASALGWLNLIIQDIQNRQQNWHWRWLEKTATTSTVASQLNYELPTDIDTNKVLQVYDQTNDFTYRFIPYDRFKRMVADPSNNTGDPKSWTLWANELLLYPVPLSVITVFMDYVSILTDASDNSTELSIPDKYRSVIIDGVLTYAYKFDPEMGNWQNQEAIYEIGIKKMLQDNQSNPAEIVKSESHRYRLMRNKIDGRNSEYFPLAEDYA